MSPRPVFDPVIDLAVVGGVALLLGLMTYFNL